MPRAIEQVVTNYIHAGKQLSEETSSMLLTAGRIGTFEGKGSLDFGGSEYSAAPISWLQPVKGSAEDKHGWWRLQPGSYLLELNESLQLHSGETAVLQVWEEVVRAGASHPTQLIRSSRETPATVLQVAAPGIDIKENARISRVYLL